MRAVRDKAVERLGVAKLCGDERTQGIGADFAEKRKSASRRCERGAARLGVSIHGHSLLPPNYDRCRNYATVFIRLTRAATRDSSGIASDQLEAVVAPHGEIRRLHRKRAAEIGEIEDAQHAALAHGNLTPGLRRNDYRTHPRPARVRSTEAARVKLRAEFAHPVFIPNRDRVQPEKLAQPRV